MKTTPYRRPKSKATTGTPAKGYDLFPKSTAKTRDEVLKEKHAEETRRRKAERERREYLATEEGAKYKADCEEHSAKCRTEWMNLETQKAEIRRMLPRDPLLVCTGGRTFCEVRDVAGNPVKELEAALDERRALYWVLDTIKPSKVIQGGAWGADRWCKRWAAERGVECVEVMADWDRLHHQAGPERNARMVADYGATAGVVFPSSGPGTKDCHARLLKAELPVYVATMRASSSGLSG